METEMLQERITCYNIDDSERHQYDREFLLRFQFSPICNSKPANLPSIDHIVLDEAHAGTKALIPGKRISIKNDFPMRQNNGGRNTGGGGGGGRNLKHLSNGTGSQNSPARPQKVIQAPSFDNIELKTTENFWVRSSEKAKDVKEEDKPLFELNRSVCSILNKLTPQKFKPLVKKMMELKIDSAAKLELAINLIFEKAVSEPGFSIAYARMCRHLTDQFNNVPVQADEPDTIVTFRQMLLRRVQAEFEKESSVEKLIEEERAKTFDTEAEKKAWLEELDKKELLNRRRMLGNIKFIGELFKLQMISENIMHECCIYKLLQVKNPDSLEDQLECICKLLTTIGKDLDHPNAKAKMDTYFDQMKGIIETGNVSSRIKFALTDVIELRQNAWVPRNDDGNLKTINQIHREAQEREKANDMTRQQEKIQRNMEPKGGRENDTTRQQEKIQRNMEPKGGRENDTTRHQEKTPRKLQFKRGRGGRDSPSFRPGGQSGGRGGRADSTGRPGGQPPASPVGRDCPPVRPGSQPPLSPEVCDGPSVAPFGQPEASDGWNTVPNKSGRQVTASVDNGKFRSKKNTEISFGSFGPGGAEVWSKGANDGGSRSESGSNTPTREIDQRTNRFDLLGDTSVSPSAFENGHPGSRQTTPTGKGRHKGRQNSSRKGRNQSPGKSNRNQSHGPGRSTSNKNPVPSNMCNGDSLSHNHSSNGHIPTASQNLITDEKMRKVTKSIVDEYLSCKDEKEALLCLRELESPRLHNVFVEEAINIVIEKKPEHRKIIGSLLQRMMKDGLIHVNQMCQGLAGIVELAPDYSVDIPHIYKYFGEVLGPIIYDGTLPLDKVKDTLEPLIQLNAAGIVMAEALSIAVQTAGKEELIIPLWSNSKITWDMLLRSDENKDQFIKDKKMEFTLKSYQHSQTPNHAGEQHTRSHACQIQEELLRILNNNKKCESNEELINYIEKNVDAVERKSTSFIGQLTKAVCSSSISKDSSNNCYCNKELLNLRKCVLLKYIDGNKEMELHSLYTLQQLVHELKHPRGLLRVLFQELYEGGIISKEIFFTWEKSKESPVGKRAALSFVRDFLTWLRKGHEQSNDEDPSKPPTNVA